MHFLTKRDSTDAPDQDGRPLTDNIDTGYPVLYECGIRSREIHREVNTEKPPSVPNAGGGLRYYAFSL